MDNNTYKQAYKPNKRSDRGEFYEKDKDVDVIDIDISLEDLEEELETVELDEESEDDFDIESILDDIDIDRLLPNEDVEDIEDISDRDGDIESNSDKNKDSKESKEPKESNQPKSSAYKDYKGVKNYLATGETINIKAEVIEDEGNKKKNSSNSISHSDSSDSAIKKKRRALPYSDMFAFYVKGEKTIQGGHKFTSTPDYQEVADRFNCSLESVQKAGRKQQWVKKRKAYREKLQGDFSFYGQMAADINGKVLDNSNRLMSRIQAKISHPTFMPDPDSIVVAADDKTYVEDAEGKMHLYNGNEGKLHETQILLNMTRSLELINKICNNTVQVEVDNLNLLQAQSIGNGNKNINDAESRMRKIVELTDQLKITKGKATSGFKGRRLPKEVRVRNMQEGKERKKREAAEQEILNAKRE